MSDALFAVVVGVVLLALAVNAIAIVAFVRGRWR